MPDVVLRLASVCAGHRRGRDRWRVLSDIDFSVAAGELVGVLGGRGEGKTTLLEVAAGLRTPEAGSVWFQGMDLARCSEDERSELLGDGIAWMPRGDFAEFRVCDYVALPLRMGGDGGGMVAAEERAIEALRRVGAEGSAARLWEELSDWERLMVAFARGYAARPRLMVIDDLLDGLGAGGTRQAGELLLEFAAELDCGVLVAASDMTALLAVHRVLYFDGEGGIATIADTPDNATNVYPLDGHLGRRAAGEQG